MNENNELTNRIIEMTTTTGEAVLHIQLLIKEGNIRNTYYIMKDILNALEAIDDAIDLLNFKTFDANYQRLFSDVIDSFDVLMDFYDNNDIDGAEVYIDKEIIPSFLGWKNEIHSLLNIRI